MSQWFHTVLQGARDSLLGPPRRQGRRANDTDPYRRDWEQRQAAERQRAAEAERERVEKIKQGKKKFRDFWNPKDFSRLGAQSPNASSISSVPSHSQEPSTAGPSGSNESSPGALTPQSAPTPATAQAHPSFQPDVPDTSTPNFFDVKKSLGNLVGIMDTSSLRQDMAELRECCGLLAGWLEEVPELTPNPSSDDAFVALKINQDLTEMVEFLNKWSDRKAIVQQFKHNYIQIHVQEFQERFDKHLALFTANRTGNLSRCLAEMRDEFRNRARTQTNPEQIKQADDDTLNQNVLYFTGHTPDASYILKRAIEDYEQSLQHPGDIFDVRKGWLKDGHEAVAVKMYRKAHKNDKDGVRVVERILRQVQLWTSFSSPYILECYGMSMQITKVAEEQEAYDEFQLYLVSPWMKHRDAVGYLKKRREASARPEALQSVVLGWIQQAAHGIRYLHHRKPACVHASIRGENVIIKDDGIACLNGFGLTKVHSEDKPVELTGKKFQVRWMAPELLTGDEPALSPACDIWSWAMTALELITGQEPYHHLKTDWAIRDAIIAGAKPQRDHYPTFETASQPDLMWALLEKCWARQANDRPTIEEIIVELEIIEKAQFEQQTAPHVWT